MRICEWAHGPYRVSTDASSLDVDLVAKYLSTESYWARGISRELVERSLRSSLCFGLYRDEEQVGFARVISDLATIAYLGDVFVLEGYRGRGLSKFLMQCVMEHPDLQGLRRWILGTRDAHTLYERYGFTALKAPEKFMERHDPDVYAVHAVAQPDEPDSE